MEVPETTAAHAQEQAARSERETDLNDVLLKAAQFYRAAAEDNRRAPSTT